MEEDAEEKGMKHSNTNITVRHYIQNFDTLEIEKYRHRTMSDILQGNRQARIIDY